MTELHAPMRAAQIQSQTCYWLNCSDCADECWEDRGIAHFSSEAELIETLVKSYEWTFTKHDRPLCARCTEKADCLRDGHQYDEWRTHPRDPGVLSRWCDHCGHFEETLADLVPRAEGGTR